MGTEILLVLPPRYGDPFIEEEEGEEEGVEEEENGWVRDCLKEKQFNGLGRGSSHGIGRRNGRGFYSQASLERNQRDRQEEEWSSPASDGRGGRDIPVSSPTVPEPQQRTPPTPAPSEDRFFHRLE